MSNKETNEQTKKAKIKISTIARIAALSVALVNNCLALFGRGSLPFTDNMAYQVVSIVLTIVVAAINCWYNNDITQLALLTGKVFTALKDGKVSEDEVKSILHEIEDTDAENDLGGDNGIKP